MPKVRARATTATPPPRQIIARVDRDGFAREETFASKVDADHWLDMMNATLDNVAKVKFDLQAYAEGLAYSVRRYAGPQTSEAWLRADAPPQLWMRGRVFGLIDLEDQINAVLQGKHQR